MCNAWTSHRHLRGLQAGSPIPGVHPNSRPLSQWCHPAISSFVVPFSSCPQSLPASESFPMSQLFAWGGQSTGISALVSFLPKNTQDWSPLEWTGWMIYNVVLISDVYLSMFDIIIVVQYLCETDSLQWQLALLLKCGVAEDSWESLGLQGDPTSPFWRRSALGFLWKEWC